jgi:protein-S-isoprenylcysteine O-methyltransferase Ste14
MPTSKGDTPGVIAPPPLIFVAFLLVGWALERWVLTDISVPVDERLRAWLALALIALGLVVEAAAANLFRRAKTAIEPWKPSTALVTDGVFKFTRNPVYLGFAITYIGLAVGLDSPVALALLFPCLIIIDRLVIAREEIYLEAKFGESYRAYKRSVRRWL